VGIAEIEASIDAGAADSHTMRRVVSEVRLGQQRTQQDRIDTAASRAP
jgi:hypothetical protein